MFRAPDESSPPSTPGGRLPQRDFEQYGASEPSTTPAGPPPAANSTTPLGPPPSSLFFGSSIPRSLTYPARSNLFDTLASNSSTTAPKPRAPGTRQDYIDDYDAMDEDMEVMDDVEDLTSYPDSRNAVAQPPGRPDVAAIAKAFAGYRAPLDEPDDLILETEKIIQTLFIAASEHQTESLETDLAISSAIHQLSIVWGEGRLKKHVGQEIGPGLGTPRWSKASFLTDLLLPLHHPPQKGSLQYSAQSSRIPHYRKPVPEVLLDWLRSHYDPFPGEFEAVLWHQVNPTSHERFWDVIFNSVLRGNLQNAIQLLKEADFREAITSIQDGAQAQGYGEKQLGSIQKVVNRMILVLQACPAVALGDWNVAGVDWSIFRKKVSQAMQDLEALSEASDNPSFGRSSTSSDRLSKGEAGLGRVPWTIHQNLRYLYTQLQGVYSEILAASANWIEASIALAVWWDGEDSGITEGNTMSNQRLGKPSQALRLVDVHPTQAYKQRLGMSLAQVLNDPDNADEPDLQINPANAIEVALACIFEDDIDNAVGILHGFSWPIATATAEIASLAGWSGASPSPSKELMSGFDQSDLMVLSYGPNARIPLMKDILLESYACLIEKRRPSFKDSKGRIVESQQIAIGIFSRMQNQRHAAVQIENVLDSMVLEDSTRLETMVSLCHRLNLHDQARKLSLRFADHLLDKSHRYGEALLQYARASESRKMKDVLDSLVTLSITQSTAFPPIQDADETLRSLIASPKRAISKFSYLDDASGPLLLAHASGYATLRRFYDIRDQVMGEKPGQKLTLPLATRKKEAARALMAVVTSAADSIHGGLYDETINSAIPVDILLTLLGEALPFLNQSLLLLTSRQLQSLLKAVEDFSSSPASVRMRCEAILKLALSNYNDPQSAMSSSALTASSSEFSLIGSSMLKSLRSGLSDVSGSGVLVKEPDKRGWDWRKGLRPETSADELLMILRYSLSKELARLWVDIQV